MSRTRALAGVSFCSDLVREKRKLPDPQAGSSTDTSARRCRKVRTMPLALLRRAGESCPPAITSNFVRASAHSRRSVRHGPEEASNHRLESAWVALAVFDDPREHVARQQPHVLGEQQNTTRSRKRATGCAGTSRPRNARAISENRRTPSFTRQPSHRRPELSSPRVQT